MLGLLRHDLTNEQIADQLDISLDGAKYHVSQILSKLGVSSREEAAEWRPEDEGRERVGVPHLRRWALAPLALKAVGVAGAVAAVGGLGVLGVALLVSSGGSDATAEAATRESAIFTVYRQLPVYPSTLLDTWAEETTFAGLEDLLASNVSPPPNLTFEPSIDRPAPDARVWAIGVTLNDDLIPGGGECESWGFVLDSDLSAYVTSWQAPTDCPPTPTASAADRALLAAASVLQSAGPYSGVELSRTTYAAALDEIAARGLPSIPRRPGVPDDTDVWLMTFKGWGPSLTRHMFVRGSTSSDLCLDWALIVHAEYEQVLDDVNALAEGCPESWQR